MIAASTLFYSSNNMYLFIEALVSSMRALLEKFLCIFQLIAALPRRKRELGWAREGEEAGVGSPACPPL